jgi:hypothetical protein
VRSRTPRTRTNRRHTSGRIAVAGVVEDRVADEVVDAKRVVAVALVV